MTTRKPGMDEFTAMIGETQQRGSGRDIYALARDPGMPHVPLPTRLPPGVAKPPPANPVMQVLSVFETRPLYAFDFVTWIETIGNFDPPQRFGSFTVPAGFTAVVRRVEFDVAGSPFNGGQIGAALIIRLTMDGNPIPLNELRLIGLVETYGWETHQVIEQNHDFGVAWEVQPGSISGDSLDIGFRVFGNLIRSQSKPAPTEVGSPPLNVRS